MKLNIEQLEQIMTYIIANNKKLQAKRKKPTAVEIMGESGIGKTSTILQITEKLGMDCVKLNLTQIEEVGDLVGYPIKEYEICKDGDEGNCFWISKDLLEAYIKNGYVPTGKHQMSYATPTWVPKELTDEGGVLILDDWNRADPRFLQAMMELIDRGQYISWELPKNWTIVLTSNPDNGDYNVNSLDNAQKTRYVSFELDFDVQTWARWAEEEEVDGRLINFCLSYPEIFNKDSKKGTQTVNARSMVTFANTISGLGDFQKPSTLALIQEIAAGCFTSEVNHVGTLFTTFINNKLDKLITPEQLVYGKWGAVKKELEAILYDSNGYRASIASMMSTRFINYVNIQFEKKGKDVKTEDIVNRILELIDESNEQILLSEDLIFNMIKTLAVKHPVRMKKLIANPKVAKRLMK